MSDMTPATAPAKAIESKAAPELGQDAQARRPEHASQVRTPLRVGQNVQFSRDRVLPQDTALKGAADEKSTPETLMTACQAASWLARS
jgi:hypothetical protein